MFFRLPSILRNNTKWLEKRQTSILSAAFIITVANATSALAGLIKERQLVSIYFDTLESRQAYDAFQLAFRIPDMLFKLIIVGAISSAFIPIFTQLRNRNEEEAFKVSAAVMNILMFIFVLAAILVFVFAEPLTKSRTGQGFTPEQINIAITLTRVMLLSSLFFGVSNFLTGILQSYQRFIVSAIAPVFYNLGILVGVYLFSSQLGIYAAGVGVVLGAFLHMLIQLPLAWKLGFRFKLSFNFRHPDVRRLFKLIPPRFFALSVVELQNLSLDFFATTIGNLSLTMINLASKILFIPIRVFGVPISQASLPFLSEESADREKERFKRLVLQSLNQITFFSLPASVLILILRLPIVRLVYGAENFPWPATVMMSKVVAIIAVSVFVQAMVHLLIRAFYALKDTRTPFLVALINLILYFFISWVAVFVLKTNVLGLAVAASVTAFIEVFLFILLLEFKVKGLFVDRAFFLPQLKMIAASFLMAVFLYLPYRILDELVFDTSRTLELIALTVTTSTIGMLVYIYFVAIFDLKELSYFAELISKFGRWRKPLEQSKEVLIESNVEGDEMSGL
ncbi:MAG: murein biosynthesis integral membrane protein MurJ [Candidatus Woesebacteria bacterium]|jgi:putative peptidoglycan lipid II flippase